MAKAFPPRRRSFAGKFQLLWILALAFVMAVGCSHQKTNRGHLFRGDWAFEYNRTPWIGCPPDSGCDDQRTCGIDGCEECGQGGGFLGCLRKKSGTHGASHEHGEKTGKKTKGFRRHCGLRPDCSAERPCCRTLGCGMWIDPSDPTAFATLGGGAKACGMTPFCSPMKPCGLTPNCGRVVNQSLMSPNMLMLGNSAVGNTGLGNNVPVMMPPSPTQQNPGVPMPTPVLPPQSPKKPSTTVAGPTGMLISRGIVPGVSAVTTGGLVAAAGVATPMGMMTAAGVQLPTGQMDNNSVLRVCMAHPNCTPARPCGMSPGCGGRVPLTMVANNAAPTAMMLVSAMQTPGTPNPIMQAYGPRVGNGMLVNPATGLPVNGISMAGYTQMGYPPIGYAPTGYAPGYPRYAGMSEEEAEEPAEEEAVEPEMKSAMPVPKFHPIPSKPAFQRSKGLPVPKRTTPGETAQRVFSDDGAAELALDDAVEQAYLEGMSAAMDEVEQEIAAREQELAKSQLQEKILNQAKKLQTHLESQKERELQVLAVQERQQEPMEAEDEIEAEIKAGIKDMRTQLALAQKPKKSAPLREPALREPARIPADYVQYEQEVAPVNYQVNYQETSNSRPAQRGAIPNTAQRSNMAQHNRVQQQMMQQALMQQQLPSPMYPTTPQFTQKASMGGMNLLNSAKSLGSNVTSTLGDVVAPLSGLLGSNRPQNLGNHPTQYRQMPAPPYQVARQRGQQPVSALGRRVSTEEWVTDEEWDDEQIAPAMPTRPPTVRKKPRGIPSEGEEEMGIRQVAFEEAE